MTFKGFVLFILFSFKYSASNNLKSENFDLIKKDDMPNNKVILYLLKDKVSVDSLTLLNLNFALDSLTYVEVNVWHYIFSQRCGSNCRIRKQIVIKELNEKIHIQFAGYFAISSYFDDLYLPDTTIKPADVMEFPYIDYKYTFAKKFFKGEATVVEYIYKGKVPDNGKGEEIPHNLKYEPVKDIYYNQKRELKGMFYLYSAYDRRKSKEIFENAYALKFKDTELIYFEEKWYSFDEKNKELYSFY